MVPHDSGIYRYTKDRDGKPQMIVLERASYQGAKTGGMFASAMTYGIVKTKTKAVIPGQHAGIKVSDPSSVFYFYFDDKQAGQDLLRHRKPLQPKPVCTAEVGDC
jgi:hypothetical protein